MGTTADKLAKLNTTKAALKSAINGSGNVVGDVFSAYPSAISSGKSAIAQAITDKGVTTAANATFQQMATNIGQIKSGGGTAIVSFTGDLGFEGFYSFQGEKKYGLGLLNIECDKGFIFLPYVDTDTFQLSVTGEIELVTGQVVSYPFSYQLFYISGNGTISYSGGGGPVIG